jgi:ribonuclease HI
MPWARRRYRGNKVWIETDDGGAPVLDERGLARLRYRPEDERTYSVRPSEVLGIDAGAGAGSAGGEGARAPRRGSGRAATPRPGRTTAPSAPTTPTTPTTPTAPETPRVRGAARPASPADEFEPGDDVPALAGLAVHVYTDGASSGNPGPAGAGAVLLFREHRKELSRYLGETTNNVAELEAVLLGLSAVKNRQILVRLHSDSSYVIGVLDRSMRAKANAALVARIHAEMDDFADLRFVKVAGHAGVEHNERADALARAEIRRHRKGQG